MTETSGAGIGVPAPVTAASQTARSNEAHTMTTTQYLAALKKLQLTPHGKATSAALGLSLRQLARYAAGEPIPPTVGLLLEALQRLSHRPSE